MQTYVFKGSIIWLNLWITPNKSIYNIKAKQSTTKSNFQKHSKHHVHWKPNTSVPIPLEWNEKDSARGLKLIPTSCLIITGVLMSLYYFVFSSWLRHFKII